jgi:hypothetical protein
MAANQLPCLTVDSSIVDELNRNVLWLDFQAYHFVYNLKEDSFKLLEVFWKDTVGFCLELQCLSKFKAKLAQVLRCLRLLEYNTQVLNNQEFNKVKI